MKLIKVGAGRQVGDVCGEKGLVEVNFRGVEPAGVRKVLGRSGASEGDLDGYYRLPKLGNHAKCADYVRVTGSNVKAFKSCKPLTRPHRVVCAGKNEEEGEEVEGDGVQSGSGDGTLTIVLAVGISVVGVLVLIALICCWYFKRQQKIKVGGKFLINL